MPLRSIVFAHGLGGHPRSTWASNAYSPKSSAEPQSTFLSRIQGKAAAVVRSIKPTFATMNATLPDAQSASESVDAEDDPEEPNPGEEGHTDQEVPQEVPLAKDVYWPKDLLANDFSDSRVITYGYDSRVNQLFGTVPHYNLLVLGRNLLRNVADQRISCVGVSGYLRSWILFG